MKTQKWLFGDRLEVERAAPPVPPRVRGRSVARQGDHGPLDLTLEMEIRASKLYEFGDRDSLLLSLTPNLCF